MSANIQASQLASQHAAPVGLLFFQADAWQDQFVQADQSLAEKDTQRVLVTWQGGEYPNGEAWIKLDESWAKEKLPVIQIVARFMSPESAKAPSLAEQVLRLFLLLEVARRQCQQLKLFLPYLPFSLQDRDVHGGDAIGVLAFIRSLEAMGVDAIQIIDAHSPQDLEYFTIPVEHLSAERLLAEKMHQILASEGVAVVAPDKGAAHKAHRIGEMLDVPVTYLLKKRLGPGEVIIDTTNLEELQAKQVVLVDDLLNTGGTLVQATKAIREQTGAEVNVAITHGLFANGAVEKLRAAGIEHIFVTDTYDGGGEKESLPGVEIVTVQSLLPLLKV